MNCKSCKAATEESKNKKYEVGNKKRSTLTADFGYNRRHCGSNSCAYFMQFIQIEFFFLEASTERFGGITCPSMQRSFYLNWSHAAHSYIWQMLYKENASVWHTGFKWQHFKIEQNKMRIWFPALFQSKCFNFMLNVFQELHHIFKKHKTHQIWNSKMSPEQQLSVCGLLGARVHVEGRDHSEHRYKSQVYL